MASPSAPTRSRREIRRGHEASVLLLRGALLALAGCGATAGEGDPNSRASVPRAQLAPATMAATVPATKPAAVPATVPAAVPAAPAESPVEFAEPASGPLEPPWAGRAPTRTLSLAYEAASSPEANGARLRTALTALQPGDRLEVAAGRYACVARLGLVLEGRADAPIWIVGATDTVLTRPDRRQNVVNFERARFVALQGFEVTGGDNGLKLYDCEDVWLDRLHVHHCGGVALAANSCDTARLWITRNHIHDTSGDGGEGMYLGANHGEFVTHHCVIAGNHVHHCGGSQGDGIELKQGSYGNRIVANEVHDTNYPCVLVYGTAGREPNVIERNVCYRSHDNVMQVQGEAIVRNNLLCGGDGAGFASHDHQGETRELVVVHNTILTRGRGAELRSWGGRPGMVFANNAVYSEDGDAMRVGGEGRGVTVCGNVVCGRVAGVDAGFVQGRGLADFVGAGFDGRERDVRPSDGSVLRAGADVRFAVEDELSGAVRRGAVAVGCRQP